MLHQKMSSRKYLENTYQFFISTSNGYISEIKPALGVISELAIFFSLSYLIILISYEISIIVS